jgi:hypothetical protein
MTNWPVEEIPDSDDLYMRVHKMFVLEGELQPSVFRNHGDGMSTHWSKYCTAETALTFAKRSADNGVVSLRVGSVRAVPLSVEHTPSEVTSDRSHADVRGAKTAEARLRLLDIATWQIRLILSTE